MQIITSGQSNLT